MKATLYIISLLMFISCDAPDNDNRIEQLEKRIAVLEETSVPGLGSMMNQVQVYHTKLFYATKSNNEEVMAYVLHELEEVFEHVQSVHNTHDGVEIGNLADNIILPQLEAFEKVVEQNDSILYVESFDNLTVACNKCHRASGHQYIRIKNPEGSTYLNQQF